MTGSLETSDPWVMTIAIAAAAVVAVIILRSIIGRSITRFGGYAAVVAWEKLRNPLVAGVTVILLSALRPLYPFGDSGNAFADRLLVIGAIAVIAWSISKVFSIIEALLIQQFRMDESDNLRARKVQTQFALVKRIGIALIVVIAVATALLTFDTVRQLGATILAGAGVAGVILGLAAQRTLGLVLSGMQVTEALERVVELRVLVSAADAPSLWDLRCAVREGLLSFIAREYPERLPRVRAELDGPPDWTTGARAEAQAGDPASETTE